jgi:hypothetical protein
VDRYRVAGCALVIGTSVVGWALVAWLVRRMAGLVVVRDDGASSFRDAIEADYV